jgi:hypothetical protein
MAEASLALQRQVEPGPRTHPIEVEAGRVEDVSGVQRGLVDGSLVGLLAGEQPELRRPLPVVGRVLVAAVGRPGPGPRAGVGRRRTMDRMTDLGGNHVGAAARGGVVAEGVVRAHGWTGVGAASRTTSTANGAARTTRCTGPAGPCTPAATC